MRFLTLVFLAFCWSAAWAVPISGLDLVTGKTTQVRPGTKGTVAIFLSSKCPCSNSHMNVLKKLAQEFKDFNFVAIHSNADETAEQAGIYFKAAGLPFPVVQDESSHLADSLKALKTPHAYVFSLSGEILFKGGVTSSHEGDTGSKQYLREALEDIRAGREVRVKEARTLGCAIARNR